MRFVLSRKVFRLPTRSETRGRHGAVVPLTAILMVFLLGMLAFAIDLGYLAVVKAELQNAADAAALAGASQILDRDELAGQPNQSAEIAAAREQAVALAGLNRVAGRPVYLDANTANDPAGDVVVGYLPNPADHQNTLRTDVYPYNSVQVRIRLSRSHGSPLALFFGPVLGRGSQDLEVTATATYEGEIRGFRITATGPQTSKLLPFALDINAWNRIASGQGDDNWFYDPATGQVRAGRDNIKEGKMYPLSNNGASGNRSSTALPPGNFGTIDIGAANNSTADIERQIRYGPNRADFERMGGGFFLGADGTLIVTGDTGISAGFKDALQSIIGQPRVLPLYRPPVTGTGNNARFTIVGFAGVIVTDVKLTGALSSKQVTIQPEFVFDGTAVGGGSAQTSRFVYRPLQLTH